MQVEIFIRKLFINSIVFYFSGITNHELDMLVAYFPTAALASGDLFFVILEGIMLLEMKAGVHVSGIVGKYVFFYGFSSVTLRFFSRTIHYH